MPLEIRELVIRTTVSSDRASSPSAEMVGEMSEEQQAAIIAACADQVLAVLQSRTER